ncbi:MAG: phosphoenolpyruvate--protein phosphotransferase [Elusimicrobiota bacterium]
MKLKGTPASPGIAIGRAHLLEEDSYCVIKRNIGKKQVKKEQTRFKNAISEAREEFNQQKDRVSRDIGKKYSRLFDAYNLILEDPLLYKDTLNIISDERVNAEYALQSVVDRITKTFTLMDDEYMKDRVNDIQDVGNKVMRILLGQNQTTLKDIQTRVALIAHTLHPSDAVKVRKEKVIGFATDIGGRTSHIVIMAESLNIPAVVGLKRVSREVSPGDLVIIDGNTGFVFINPDPSVIREYRKKKSELREDRKRLVKLRDKPAVTRCGEKVTISANIEEVQEADYISEYGPDSIGLYRTEYLYLNRMDLPSEDEIYDSIVSISRKMSGKKIVVRTVDLGADKLSAQLKLSPERNSFMGMRGIRLSLAYPGFFKTQLRAFLRASRDHDIALMYPMVTTVKELRTAEHILDEVMHDLRSNDIDFDDNIEIGAMIETPSAALEAEIFAREVDFFSIGTNDLIQYTLAVNRISESVSYMYNPVDLAVLRLLEHVIKTADENDIWVSMCGEMASDTLYTELLLGMGLRKFSMNAMAIPKVKQVVRKTTVERSKKLFQKVKNFTANQGISKVLRESRDELFKLDA